MIEILPETEAQALVVKARHKLTKQDYEEIFIPRLNRMIEQFGRISALVYFDEDFTGWELGAAWDDAVFGIKHRHDFEKLAVVGDQQWLTWAVKLGAWMTDAQIITYQAGEFKQAVAWLKES